ncbi:MAG: hypothetical protein KKC76_03265, partial [Proteobacteria bacterium]|nr:hypothetical protein [Pseudomonadota bacterium]MCG2747146.1 hypothetical protein [Desulfobulbaceae bacterium]
PRAVDETPVPLRSTGVSSTAVPRSEVTANAKPGQRRSAALEVECAASDLLMSTDYCPILDFQSGLIVIF